MTPWYLLAPPQEVPGSIGRPRVRELVDDAVRRCRVVQVAAPAGHGKTSALAEWSRQAGLPVAWLTLSAGDQGRQRLFRGVVESLQHCAKQSDDERLAPLLRLNPDVADTAVHHLAIGAALDDVRGEIALVVDDLHVLPDVLAEGVLATLLDNGPSNLRLVLGSREQSPELARARIAGAAVVLGTSELRFSVDEVVAASAAIGVALTAADAERLTDETGGWAAAVRLALLAHDDGSGAVAFPDPDALLTDYVATEVLGRLPADLRDFVLAATTCEQVDPQLAGRLSGREDAGALLEESVRRGLFLDRHRGPDGEPSYRWHPVFANECRAVLGRSDAARARTLRRAAALHLRHLVPLDAAVHAQAAGDPALARTILASSWLNLLVDGEVAGLAALCARMPADWLSDALVLLVRACCCDLADDRAQARMLLQQAEERLAEQPVTVLEAHRLLARLIIVDDHAALLESCDLLHARLHSDDGIDPALHNAAMFLLGWTELRLRRDPRLAVELLSAASAAGQAAGQRVLAHRASANAAFALAFQGELVAARAALVTANGASDLPDEDAWQAYDGGIESFTAGFVDFWQDRLRAARAHFRDVLVFDGDASYAGLSRVFLGFAAAASGDPREIDSAELGLDAVQRDVQHGVPWGTYATIARARIAAAQDDLPRALALGAAISDATYVPVVVLELAWLHLQSGDLAAATGLLHRLSPLTEQPSYVRVGALVANALIQLRRGETDSAHRLVERSLAIAEPQGIARPYGERVPALRRLLIAHAERGTHHTEFLAARIAGLDRPSDGSPSGRLSKRELEVLSYMRGTMTTAEIAQALHVSVNTVKTHQRLIYRKLGVTSRKEAVSVTRETPEA